MIALGGAGTSLGTGAAHPKLLSTVTRLCRAPRAVAEEAMFTSFSEE
jgi:hypothetical protein